MLLMNQNVWDSYKHEKNPEKIVSIHWQFFKRFSSSFNLVEILNLATTFEALLPIMVRLCVYL
jgi:hypothetical protein